MARGPLPSLLFGLGLVACGRPPGDAAPATGDSAADRDDTARIVHGGIEELGIRRCPDPSARDTSPLFRPREPGDFATAQPPASIDEPTGWGVSAADLDGDGHLDLLLPQGGPPQLFRGDGAGRLDLVPDAFPDTGDAPTYGSAVVDVEGDGDLDVFLTRVGPDVLWLNDGTGRFTDGTEAAGLGGDPYDSIHSAWGDYDGDGDLDLFVANYWTEALHQDEDETSWRGDPNRLWENDGRGRFTDRSALVDWQDASRGFTFLGAWWDVDGDLDPELYVVNDKGYLGFENALARHDGAGFHDVGEGSGVDVAMRGMGLGAADLNGDEVPDFLVTDWGRLWLLLSDGAGGWYDATLNRGLQLPLDDGRIVGWGAELEDLDNDGDADALVTFGNDDLHRETRDENGVVSQIRQRDGVWLQGEDGVFGSVVDTWGLGEAAVGRGFALADLDGNGWLDLVRRDLVGVTRVDLQACGAEAWLGVTLSAPPPNTWGVGARVELEAGGHRDLRWIHAGGTNLASGSAPGAHVGLGDVDVVDVLRIRWPDGGLQEFHDVPTRQRVRVWRE